MLKVFYCIQCNKITYMCYNNVNCKICNSKMKRLPIEFVDFVNLNEIERDEFLKKEMVT